MSQLSGDFGRQGKVLQWGGLWPPGPHRAGGRITAKHRVNELMSENAQGVILDGTVPENSLTAPHYKILGSGTVSEHFKG